MLTADAVDEHGVPVQAFTRDLKWAVEGPARLLTPEVYQSDIARRAEPSGVYYIAAPVCTVIRATGQPGEIKVSVSAEGVAPATIEIKATLPKPEKGLVRVMMLGDEGRKAVAHDPNADKAAKAKRKPPSDTM